MLQQSPKNTVKLQNSVVGLGREAHQGSHFKANCNHDEKLLKMLRGLAPVA